MLRLNIYFSGTEAALKADRVTMLGLHGLLFNVLKQTNPALATQLHEHRSPKPFSFTPLYQHNLLAGMRVAVFDSDLAQGVADAWLHQQHNAQAPLRLGPQQFLVTGVEIEQTLDWPTLLQSAPKRKLTLHFQSPTAFKQGFKKWLLFPLPANVFGWPLKVWNSYCPPAATIPEDWLAWCEDNVFVIRHDIETIQVNLTKNEWFVGFVGGCNLKVLDKDAPDYYLQSLHALARLAAFTGVGHKTTAGMGALSLE